MTFMATGTTRSYRDMLARMEKYPNVFEDDIRCIKKALRLK
jgi:hypothetical protein